MAITLQRTFCCNYNNFVKFSQPWRKICASTTTWVHHLFDNHVQSIQLSLPFNHALPGLLFTLLQSTMAFLCHAFYWWTQLHCALVRHMTLHSTILELPYLILPHPTLAIYPSLALLSTLVLLVSFSYYPSMCGQFGNEITILQQISWCIARFNIIM